MSGSLEGRVAVVVGSSSGMGRATARAFAESGAKVALASRDEAALTELAAEIGPNALVCPTDARDVHAVNRMVAATLEAFGRLDILVYSTGTNIPDRSVERLTPDTWDMMVATNLSGAFYCTKAVVPTMREQGDGVIIYISSGCVQFPDTSGVSYQATKHGMKGLSYGTLKEEKANGVRTSVIFPGLCDTPLVLQRPVKTPDDVLAQALKPGDVADACLYVATLPARACVPELVLLPSGLA